MTKCLDCAKIFILHRDQMPKIWADRIGFESSWSFYLAFVLIYQELKAKNFESFPKLKAMLTKTPEIDSSQRDDDY